MRGVLTRMRSNIEYVTSFYAPEINRETDLGIDLTSREYNVVKPGKVAIIDTGTSFKFPTLGNIRRLVITLLFGIDIVGVGGLLWPKSRDDFVVLAGVIDTDYRGTIKVKIFNSTDHEIEISPGDQIAQMVPILNLNFPLVKVKAIRKDTSRGTSGGINELR